ncbi:MAG: heme-binding protein [Saprospiraceae bacterium]
MIVVFVLFQSFSPMSINTTEEQKYKVVRTYEDFEIRFYPSTVIATFKSDAKTYNDLSGPGFQKLAGYIFGGNEANMKISMTSPVHMDVSDSVSTMSFVMPSEYTKKTLPKPNDTSVNIINTEDEYVAAIRFSGFATDQDRKDYTKKLQDLLKENSINSFGHYRFLGYDPPYQMRDRRNEIVVTVKWKE